MHGMLGLAALELAEIDTEASSLICAAIHHRVRAIKTLNQALSRGIHTFEEGNAMLATCYTLLFQSVLLDDGLPEFMTFIRGCVLVAFSMGCKSLKILFNNLLGHDQLAQMEPHLTGPPPVDAEVVDAACQSLEAFAPLCRQEYEKSFHGLLLKTARALYTSPRNGMTSHILFHCFQPIPLHIQPPD
jgi:hypothetical protein